MRNKATFLSILALVLTGSFGSSCNSDLDGYKITVTNKTDFVRSSETIEISISDLQGLSYVNGNEICVKNENGNRILSQVINDNSGSKSGYIIFQTDIAAGDTKEFNISVSEENPPMPETKLSTFCRIVPERLDDFAWENDRIAFRTYGPAIQKALDDSELGTAIITDTKADLTPNSDSENNWINMPITNNTFSYWAGFAWKKAGRYPTPEEWNNYISDFIATKGSPLQVRIKKY